MFPLSDNRCQFSTLSKVLVNLDLTSPHPHGKPHHEYQQRSQCSTACAIYSDPVSTPSPTTVRKPNDLTAHHPSTASPPSNFQEEKASHPLCYQFDRWMFLRVLEREVSERWALCSCCLKFHPKAQFPEAELRLPPEKRACRSRPPLTAEDGWGNRGWPMGIVDLCPCVKLTPGTRQRLRGYLRGAGGLTANAALAAPWWHQCRKVYGDIEIQVALNPFVCQNGALGVVTRYDYTFSPQSATLSPRLCCPHRNLGTWVNDVLTCQATHRGRDLCPTCKVLARCRYCATSVHGLTKRGASTDPRISCTFWTERMLDDDFWYTQVVFPFYKISGDSCSGPLRSPWISLYRFRKEVGVWRPWEMFEA